MLLFIIVSVLFFGVSVFIAEKKAPEEYSARANTIDELGCQSYDNRSIMQWGFRGFGLIIIAGLAANYSDAISRPYYSVPLISYAVFMFLAGMFSSKPFEHLVFYSIKRSKLHTLFLQLSGMGLGLLIVMKLVMVTGVVNRLLNIFILVFILYSSAQSARDIETKGVYQRVMYLGSFLWLIYAYSGMMD